MTRFYIDYAPGAGGNFLRHFLEPHIESKEAKFWIDEEWHEISGGGRGNFDAFPFNKNSCSKFDNHHPKIFTIGLGPVNTVEWIKVNTLINVKNMHRSISNLDHIITNLQYKNVDLFDVSSVTFMINYENLFNLDLLKKLYTDLHNTPVPEHKILYFKSYKQKHDEIFNCWQYKVIEKICLFEYNNNVIEWSTGKIRKWSICDITENNWQSYLDTNLCLTNYR